jgi:hypothetical protein
MQLRVDPDGRLRCVYAEDIDLACLGTLTIRRASSVEPDEQGRWWVDLTPVAGPRLGPFRLRTQALEAEQQWLSEHWLLAADFPARHGSLPATIAWTSESR